MPKTKHDDYEGFVSKFKPKKTTDDCYTPQPVYDAVKKWVHENIMPLDGVPIVRPFFPGGDYEHADYPEGCVVLDNPPFSIISKICRFYIAHNIKYFLFAPTLTLTSGNIKEETYIVCSGSVCYANGAIVNTSFRTNILGGNPKIIVSGDLHKLIKSVSVGLKSIKTRRKVLWPVHLVSTATLGRLAVRGIHIEVAAEDCHFVRKLDNMDRSIYGSGFLLSERAAAERAAAERAAAERAAAEQAQLSDREWEIVKNLGR